MAASASDVADEIQDLLRKNGMDVITFPWPDFYKVCQRERLKDGFVEQLQKQLHTRGVLLAQGDAVVLIGKDYKFSPVKV